MSKTGTGTFAEEILGEEPPEVPAPSETVVANSGPFPEVSVAELTDTLSSTIKRDNANKIITFLCCLSAYTENEQFNISFNAPSCYGKTYEANECVAYFPAEDVIPIGYCSPTSFFHDRGEIVDGRIVVNLSRKIIEFLDQPHDLLSQHIRPLLSHDRKELNIKITDKSKHAGMRTKNITIIGFPSVIFCTAGLKLDEQEATRCLLLSPEISQDKIRQSLWEVVKRKCDSESYYSAIASNPERQALKERIRAIKDAHLDDVKVIYPQSIFDYFNNRPILKPRFTRDIGRVISITKALALLNLWNRPRDGNTILANKNDVSSALLLWAEIGACQELNLPPYLYNLFNDIIAPMITNTGITRADIIREHFKATERPLPDWQLRKEILPMLEMAGLIVQEADPADRRRMLIYPAQIKKEERTTNA